MQHIEVDLKMKMVADTTRVWRLFPGKYYRFLPIFLEQSLIFLDFPGLSLPEITITKQTKFIREYIFASKAIEEWISKRRAFDSGLSSGGPPQAPSREIVTYAKAPMYDGMSSDLASIQKVFGEAKQGDLVIVPGRGRLRKIHVAELLDEPQVRSMVSLGKDYYGEVTPARRVRWFSQVDESRIPLELSLVLRTQNPVISIPDKFLFDICDVVYGTYSCKGNFGTQFATQAAEFSGQDTLDIGLLATLAASVTSDFTNGRPVDPTILSVIGNSLPEEERISLAININSPGFLNGRAGHYAPIVLSALFAVFLAGSTLAEPPAGGVQVINSEAPPRDKCTADINQTVADTMKNMLFEEWKSTCARASRLASEPRLRGDSRTRVTK